MASILTPPISKFDSRKVTLMSNVDGPLDLSVHGQYVDRSSHQYKLSAAHKAQFNLWLIHFDAVPLIEFNTTPDVQMGWICYINTDHKICFGNIDKPTTMSDIFAIAWLPIGE